MNTQLFIYIFFLTAAFSSILIFSIYLLKTGPSTWLKYVFFVKTVFLSVCVLIAILIQVSSNQQMVMFWYKIMLTAFLINAALFVHFYSELIIRRKLLLLKGLTYLTAFILIGFLYHIKNPFNSSYFRHNAFWILRESNDTVYFIFFMIFLSFCVSYSIAVLVYWDFHTKNNKEKYSARIISASMVVFFISLLVIDIIMGPSGIITVPHIAPIIISFYVLALCYALFKYHFLFFNLKEYFYEIINNINDLVIFVNPQGKIVTLNDPVQALFSNNYSDLTNHKLTDIVVSSNAFFKEFNALLNTHDKRSYHQRLFLSLSDTEMLDTNGYFSSVFDVHGDFVGVLIIAKENKNIEQFLNDYSLSQRQLELCMLIQLGLTNADIAEKLGITLRTVESHLLHIYNKVTVSNKIELINIMQQYNV
ncbi:MAG TPA: LuxR C-terminal-related transcriptional regulator [Spirochaetota bacterium]|nr:LuxR C-terminal-related transcriptional regulator [Spirochaetota bacterium]